MSVQMVNQTNNCQTNVTPNKKNNDNSSNKQILKVYQTPEDAPARVKAGVFCSTLLGVGLAMYATFKSKGMKTESIKGFFKNLKNITYEDTDINGKKTYEMEKLIGRLAIGSVGGGLIGGAIFDKKDNLNSKFRESIIQLVGNIATPLICVAGGFKLIEKITKKAPEGKYAALATAAGLIPGILLGNKVGNEINLNLFRIDEDRKIKLSDMSPHIDDVCFALSLAASKSKSKSKSKIGSKIAEYGSRIIPAALMIAGISTGCMQEHIEVINAKHNQECKDKIKCENIDKKV